MNIFTRNMNFVKFNNQDMEWIKFNGVTVYEAWKELTVSGVPPITLTKCKGVDLVEYKIYGNSYQETRSGKNLLKYPYSASLPTTQAGVTWDNDNGKIIASGTATGYSGFTLVRDIPVQANTNYRFYIVGTQSNVSIDITGTGLGINIPTTSLNNSGFVFNTGNATAITLNVKRLDSLPTSASFYPMLVIGTDTSTDYEPYGVMPSPDYPSEIESVGYKNLFDINSSDFTKNACNVSVNDNNLSVISTKNSTGYVGFNIRNIKPNQTYTFSFNSTYDYYSGYQVRSYNTDNEATVIKGTTQGNNVEYTFTTPNDISHLTIFLYCSYNTSVEIGDTTIYSNIRLIEGNEAKSYIPYGKYGIGIKVTGKNLLNANAEDTTKNGVTLTHNPDGSFSINGTATTNVSLLLTTQQIVMKNNKNYTLSLTILNNSGGSFNVPVTVLKEDGTPKYNYFVVKPSMLEQTKLTTWETTISAITAYISSGETVNATFKVQLEESDVATEYEPYKESITIIPLDEPLRSLPNGVKDIAYIKNNRLYVDRYVGSRVLDGSVGGFNETNNWYYMSMSTLNVSVNSIFLLSNYFTLRNTNNFADDITLEGICLNNTNYIKATHILIRNSKFSSKGEYVNWLSEIKPIAHYELATPITEEFDEPYNILTFKGTTILSVNTNIQPSNVEVTYIGKQVR